MSEMWRLKQCSTFHDFEFIHRGEHYMINSLLICHISPVIRKLYLSDKPTFTFEIPPVEGDFNEFISMLYGEKIPINAYNCQFLKFLGDYLEIIPISNAANKVFQEFNTIENNLQWATQLFHANLPHEKIINAIAYNMSNIYNHAMFKQLPCGLIQEILNSKQLNIENSSKFKFIQSLVDYDPEKYESLLQIPDNNKIITQFFSETVTNLELHRDQVIKTLEYSRINQHKSSKAYPFIYPNYFEGILCSRGVSPSLYIVGSSDPFDATYKVDNVVNPRDDSKIFISQSGENPYFEFKFSLSKVKITSYVIKSVSSSKFGYCPRSWKLEGCTNTNGNEFAIIDTVYNNTELMIPNKPVHFEIKSASLPYSIIRFTQLESNNLENPRLFVNSFEIFGFIQVYQELK